MERPPLTTVLSSVLSAAVENTNRPALLATLRPQLRSEQPEVDGNDIIPLPRRSPEHASEHSPRQEPDPAPAA